MGSTNINTVKSKAYMQLKLHKPVLSHYIYISILWLNKQMILVSILAKMNQHVKSPCFFCFTSRFCQLNHRFKLGEQHIAFGTLLAIIKYIYIHNCGYSICYIRVSHLVCGISPLSRCFWLSALSRTAARRCRRVSESFSGSSRQTDIAMEAMAHLLLIYLAKMVIYCRGLSTMWQSGKPNHP